MLVISQILTACGVSNSQTAPAPANTAETTATPRAEPIEAVGNIKASDNNRYWTDEEEKAVWNDPWVETQKTQMETWWKYWSAIGAPILNFQDLQFDLLVDIFGQKVLAGDPNISKKVTVVLLEKSTGKRFYYPIDPVNGGFQTLPPEINAQTGAEPFEVSDGAGKLVYRDGDLVRVDPLKGFVTEHISAGPDQSGSWTPVVYDQWMPNQFKEKMWTVKQPKVGVWEAVNDQGMLMAIKQSGKGDFVSAPNGYALPEGNGMWYKWNGSEFKFSVDINSDKPNAEIEAVAKLALKELKTGSGEGVYMFNEELMGAGMTIKPGKETQMMEDLWFAMYDSIILREQGYWKTVGFTGSNFEEFKAWAKTVGPVALKMPGPKSYGNSSGIVNYGATEIDAVGIMLLSKDQYQKDPFAKATADLVSLEKTMGWSGTSEYDRFGFNNIDGELYFVGMTRKSKFIDEGSIMTDNLVHSSKVVTFWYEQSVGIIRNTDPWRLGELVKTESTTELMSWRSGYGLYNTSSKENRDYYHNSVNFCPPAYSKNMCGIWGGVYYQPVDVMTNEEILFVQR